MTKIANIHGTDEDNLTVVLPVQRYRLIDKDGKAYSPFRVKPSSRLSEIIVQAFPDGDGWVRPA